MTNKIKMIIDYRPVHKERYRFVKNGYAYDIQKKEKKIYEILLKKELPKNFEIIEKNIPVKIEINFFFKPPKNYKKKDYELHTKKPDIDNLLKFLFDCMNKIIFHDDCQIVSVVSTKMYHKNEGTEITIKW